MNKDKFIGISTFYQLIIVITFIIMIICYQFIFYPYFLKNKKVPFVKKFTIVKEISSKINGKYEYVKDSIFEYNNGKLVNSYMYKYINVRDTIYYDNVAYYNTITKVLKDY